MDPLTEIVKAVRLEAALFFNGEFTAPWCFRSREIAEMGPLLAPGAEHVIVFHCVREGKAFARLEDGTREELRPGDIVILPHGDSHFLGNGSPEKPVDGLTAFSKNLQEGLKVAQFGGGGEVTRFVCGFLACDAHLHDVVLAGLPKLFKIHVDGPSGEWIENSIRFSVGEETGPVVSKLSEVLFAEILRQYIEKLPADSTGWLAGMRDPLIGQALALLHKDPEKDWTLESLARSLGVSRTRFADRFRQVIGESPIAYLAKWRLKLGAQKLEETDDSVAEVAASVGYGSEAAFSRAFKREFAYPPAQFRRRRIAP